MTKHLLADESFPKDPLALIEASKILETNVKILDSSHPLGIANSSVKSLHKIGPRHSLAKTRENKVKVNTVKCRLGKVMHKLYDLEPICVPEKPLNVELGVDLYQMEDY